MLKIEQNWGKIARYLPQCSTKIFIPDCRYFFQKVPNIVPSVLFQKSISIVLIDTLKVPSAHLCLLAGALNRRAKFCGMKNVSIG